ncbi:hypothetical protein PHYBLDRAFT_64664 [Phycomyces blakesleeanus NRRL 1555(-)]|uniref:Uncharacterized protein n=1 Tax=Phycomyces blakesleeanus (strain ATCC 8743b / DSM 1359 / FGSC 10004 / NBRC 33097 / NRRL 1555) TaxID=763407 RepID=A0A162PKL2_PHYB8|nr:hypothetical protein PHYBLDRAFT_64664 [Phycomyces blakesleeanus NRRL 1555(-)]OAD73707.1 hypothetical protein PHYBLDRAFT_64664 [Phycomyces blakesleeanus NRRL 1555(-)]|eukprot:XP_018291747.1 hypothetical protein PHYBLDRAFT_64664 [Phycomyces blakesleeanus NRRL 1555(-)]
MYCCISWPLAKATIFFGLPLKINGITCTRCIPIKCLFKQKQKKKLSKYCVRKPHGYCTHKHTQLPDQLLDTGHEEEQEDGKYDMSLKFYGFYVLNKFANFYINFKKKKKKAFFWGLVLCLEAVVKNNIFMAVDQCYKLCLHIMLVTVLFLKEFG